MTDIFSNLMKGQGDKGEKYYKNNVWHQFALRKKKKKDEEANILKNKMIKKNTRKVIFGKKKGIQSLLLVQSRNHGLWNPFFSS